MAAPAAPTGLETDDLPVGAKGLKTLFSFAPRLSDVSFVSTNTTSKLNAGMFYESSVGPTNEFTEVSEMLALVYNPAASLSGCGVSTQNHVSKQSALPYILTSKPFYVSCEYALSDADAANDHFSGFWMEPQEHNLAKSDVVPGQAAGYEAWTEIDVNESGNSGGRSLFSWLTWTGVYPAYKVSTVNNYGGGPVVDWSKFNRFGFRYDPVAKTGQGYCNDILHTTYSNMLLNPTHHYYLICDVASRGAKTPYQMIIKNLSAYQ